MARDPYEGRPSPLDAEEQPEFKGEAELELTAGQDDKASPSPLDNSENDSSKSGQEGSPQPSTLELEGLTQEKDGSYSLKIDDQTVYKGKTLEDVMANWKKGDLETRKALKELKDNKKPEHKREERKHEATAEVLTDEEIKKSVIEEMEKEAQRKDVDVRFLYFDDKKWQKYQDQNDLTDEELADAKKLCQGIVSKFSKQYNEKVEDANVMRQTNSIIDEEMESAQELLSELSEEERADIDIKAIAEAAVQNEDNWTNDKKHIRKGRIVLAVSKEIAKRVKAGAGKTSFEKKLETERKAKEAERKRLPGGGGTGKHDNSDVPKFDPYKSNYRDVARMFGGT